VLRSLCCWSVRCRDEIDDRDVGWCVRRKRLNGKNRLLGERFSSIIAIKIELPRKKKNNNETFTCLLLIVVDVQWRKILHVASMSIMFCFDRFYSSPCQRKKHTSISQWSSEIDWLDTVVVFSLMLWSNEVKIEKRTGKKDSEEDVNMKKFSVWLSMKSKDEARERERELVSESESERPVISSSFSPSLSFVSHYYLTFSTC
jgi:hypothetical protein